MPDPKTNAINEVIKAAQDLPSLVTTMKVVDPALADALVPKALLLSKSPWGALLGGVIGWAVTKYGLGWDQNTIDLVTGVGVLAGGYLIRIFTSAPINSVLPQKGT